ncbi:MAG TPA: CBS domain-containing protein [Gaiellaceae bacterium]|nr:CBS domain-containing protein [Gaiellaceae bacterium]
MQVVRDAMVPEPTMLGDGASAQEAGACLGENPEIRAIFVVAGDGRLVGVITRKTLAREVLAAGRDPQAVRLGEIAEPPLFTLDAALPLEEAFHTLEERDLERVPVVEEDKLVGVLSRAVVQRRLAEDEPPEPEPDPDAGALVL